MTPMSPQIRRNPASGAVPDEPRMATPAFQPKRRRWPGLLAAGAIGAAVAAAAISSFYDERPIGARIDAGVNAAQTAAATAAQDTAAATERAAQNLGSSIDDAGITAAVKTALAADPGLSALKIDVSTQSGVVRLEGPAPDEKARSRAEVLAAAPSGVARVDNRLVVAGAPTSTLN